MSAATRRTSTAIAGRAPRSAGVELEPLATQGPPGARPHAHAHARLSDSEADPPREAEQPHEPTTLSAASSAASVRSANNALPKTGVAEGRATHLPPAAPGGAQAAPASHGRLAAAGHTMAAAGKSAAAAGKRMMTQIAHKFNFFERDADGKERFKRPGCENPGLAVEIVFYMALLAVFSAVVYNMRDPMFSFHQSNMMKELFIKREFPGIKVFKSMMDVANAGEFFDWAKGPLVQGLLSDASGTPGVIYGSNYLVGLVRMRQVRIRAGTCSIPKAFRRRTNTCYGRYAVGDESRIAYGPGNMWTYASGKVLKTNHQLARWNRYDGGGFVHDLGSRNASVELARLGFLQDNGWIDMQTRAVFVDFTTYNPNVNLHCVVQLQFEFLPSGGVFPDYKVRVLRLLSNTDGPGTWFLGAQIALVVLVFFFVGEQVSMIVGDVYRHQRWRRRQARRVADEPATAGTQSHAAATHASTSSAAGAASAAGVASAVHENQARPSSMVERLKDAAAVAHESWHAYWHDGWNYFDLLNIIFFGIAFGAHLRVVYKYAEFDGDPLDRTRFRNFQEIVLWDATEKNILACNAFMLWFKVFRYTSFEPKMSMIASVSARAFKPMFFFLLMFFFVIFGFAQAGSLAFGADVPGFDTLGLTIFTMLQAALGDFDFVALRNSNRFFGPLFFFTFVVLVVFVILSMFLAIVDNTYDDVKREIQHARDPTFFQRSAAWFSTTRVGSRLVSLLSLQQQAKKLQTSIRRADRNQDGLLDAKELASVMSEFQGFFDATPEEVMRLYDRDHDNMLSIAEATEMTRRMQRVAENLIALRETGEYEFRTLFDLISDRLDKSENRLTALLLSVLAKVDPKQAEALRLERKANFARTHEESAVMGAKAAHVPGLASIVRQTVDAASASKQRIAKLASASNNASGEAPPLSEIRRRPTLAAAGVNPSSPIVSRLSAGAIGKPRRD